VTVKLEPLGDRLVLRPSDTEEVTKGGIIIPDTAKEKPQEGEVVAVGPGRISEEGKRVAMEIRVGDKVVYKRYAGFPFKLDDVDYVILEEKDVIAKRV